MIANVNNNFIDNYKVAPITSETIFSETVLNVPSDSNKIMEEIFKLYDKDRCEKLNTDEKRKKYEYIPEKKKTNQKKLCKK